MNTGSRFALSTLGSICAAAVLALLCSCASTSIKKTWKAPDTQPPSGKIAVLAIEERGLIRQGFENRFVRQLAKAEAPALVTFEQLSLQAIKGDKRAAAESFRNSGAKALLILRLAGSASSFHEIRPGGERYTSTITGIESMGWYDYYTVGFMNMSPTYGNLKQTVFLEASLYDLDTEKPLWRGLTRTVVKENMDKVAEMDPLVEKIVAAMRKDGVI